MLASLTQVCTSALRTKDKDKPTSPLVTLYTTLALTGLSRTISYHSHKTSTISALSLQQGSEARKFNEQKYSREVRAGERNLLMDVVGM